MNEIRRSLKRLAVIYFFVLLNIIPYCDLIPDVFPTRVLSRSYMITAACCMTVFYTKRIADRGVIRKLLIGMSVLEIMLIVLQLLKWSSFKMFDTAQRLSWYLFYIPMMFIPVLFFYMGISLDRKERDGRKLLRKWGWMLAVSFVFLVLFVTNDRHQLLISFKPGFENWDTDYSHEPLFFVSYVWQYALLIVSLGLIYKKCRLPSARRNSWIVLIPIVIGIIMMVQLVADKVPKLNGWAMFSVSEAMGAIIAGTLECCMCLGLIPSNENYRGIFSKIKLPIHITDRDGKVVYATEEAGGFSKEMFSLADKDPYGENIVMRVSALPGGYAFWQNDISWLNRLNEQLDDIRSQLSEEAELIQLSNELDEKRTAIEKRNDIYDEIIRNTHEQAGEISRLVAEATATEDVEVKAHKLKLISFYASFIKRYANIMLYESPDEKINTVEVRLAISENLIYLDNLGIAVEFAGGKNEPEAYISRKAAIAIYEAFYKVVSENLGSMRGCYVRIVHDDESGIQLRVNLDGVCSPADEKLVRVLEEADISMSTFVEDADTFIRFTVRGEGGAL